MSEKMKAALQSVQRMGGNKRMFEVSYSITREEKYRVMASNEAEARENAFNEGQYIEDGETTDVTDLDCKEIPTA